MADNKGIKSLWGYPLIDSKGRHAIDDVRSNLENNFQKKNDDTLTTTSKTISGAINEVNAQYKDIANLSLIKHTDGKVYIKKQDGTLIGDGIEVESDVDLSKISLSMSGQTLNLMNNGTQIATVEIPTATDKQLTSIIQSKIDDGTLTSLTLGDNSVATNNVQNKAVTPNKTNFCNVEDINLFDKSKATLNKNLNWLTMEESSDLNKAISDYIPVTTGTYIFSHKVDIVFLDENKSRIKGMGSESWTSLNLIIDNSNIKYIRFVVIKEYINNTMVRKEKYRNIYFEEYKTKSFDIIDEYKKYLTINMLSNESVIDEVFKAIKPLRGLTFAIIGDSNTNWNGNSYFDNSDFNNNYNFGFGTLVAETEKMNFVNLGYAGASWELTTIDGTNVTSEPDGDKYSAVRRVDAIIKNKADYDIVLFFMGTNRKIDGELTDTYENPYTMCGAIHYCLKKLIEYNSTLPIGIILPPQRAEGYAEQKDANNKIKSIANYYSIATLDLFNEGGVTITSHASAGQIGDGTHLSQNGVIHVAKRIAGFMESFAKRIDIPLISFAITGNTNLNIGDSTQLVITLKQTLTPTNSVIYTWVSSDKSIATVNNDGLVQAISSGNVIITATSSNGVKRNITITIS